ncbi:MAG: ATP-binding protein [Rhodococcus sp. (in: high G+C Gram-positive bacteria)]|uniref:HAMP domain-containing sensor histidine kinase n=1 Tax=Rhodococcus sp. TaxID=1831 RepID=UPI003BB5390C
MSRSMRPSRSYSPRNWRLWHKVTVVLCLPVLAASLFGASRINRLLEESGHYSAQADQVAVLPALTEYGTAVAGAAAATILSLPTENAAQIADAADDSLIELLRDGELDPEIAATLARVLEDGKQLLASASSRQLPPLAANERAREFISRMTHAYRTIINSSANPTVLAEGNILLDSWSIQWVLLDQLVAFSALREQPASALLMWNTAMGTEVAELRVLADTVPDRAPVDALIAEVENRRALTANLDSTTADVDTLRSSMFTALMSYNQFVDASAEKIVVTLDDLAARTRAESWRDGIAVATVLSLAIVLAVAMSISLVRPLRRLRDDTLRAAEHDLPGALTEIRDGADIDAVTLPPVGVHTREEVGQVARAVDTMKFEALRLAGEQSRLRRQVNEMLETLARRNKTLVEQQLSLIDSLELDEKDPARLQSLFALDHLAARMRRTGDSLLVLAGTRQRLGRLPDTPLSDVLRGATSQVENYERVHIGSVPPGNLVGSAVVDVVHLVAELLDNALRASPPNSAVKFGFSGAVDGGMLLEIADQGIGIPAEDLADINVRLASGNDSPTDATRHMGLFVVGRLAARHGITVRLRPTFTSGTNGGITASVYIPTKLLTGAGRVVDPYHVEPRRLTSGEYESVPYAGAVEPYHGVASDVDAPGLRASQPSMTSQERQSVDAAPGAHHRGPSEPWPTYDLDAQRRGPRD